MRVPDRPSGRPASGGINFHDIAQSNSHSATTAAASRVFANVTAGTATAVPTAEVPMTRAVLSAAIDTDWRLVSQERPCPVCGSQDACSVHTKDDFACCAREPSQWKLTTGAWLHRVQSRSAFALVPETIGQVDTTRLGSRIRL